MKRKRIHPKPMDPAVVAEHETVRAAVFARDGYRCLLAGRRDVPACFGINTPHHLRKSGQGGPYVVENLVTLCLSHNDTWVEGHGDAAWALGLLCRNGDSLDECWERLRNAGLVPAEVS